VRPIFVVIVSRNPATVLALQSHFETAGVPTHSGRRLRNVEAIALERATALVIFPDDLQRENVSAFVRRIRDARPRVLIVLVTGEPQRFVEAVKADGRSLPPLVLPRLSFGWDILEAIRSCGDADGQTG
jgi:hypothetical protein